MNTKEFDALLVRTFEDRRLSRGEKHLLQDALAQCAVDERQLALLRHRAFDLVRELLTDGDARSALDWLEDVSKTLQPDVEKPVAHTAEACFSPGDNCPGRIASLLDATARKIDICVFTITDDRIAQAILAAHARKVRVRIITDNDKQFDGGSDIDRLRRAGIAVKVDETEHHMHHKFAVLDDARLLNGSYNWTRSAGSFNEENLVVSTDAALVKAFARQFALLWDALAAGS